ncbi:unnamed protein product [Schistosoma mattheei]|uniref:Uncharacterized protein n=1 Tax=Schistosoma mattheei TaxID=31246 RepID=A0A183NL94_9TREM|nr:unnamed protein product [Schistosoma mattheei]
MKLKRLGWRHLLLPTVLYNELDAKDVEALINSGVLLTAVFVAHDLSIKKSKTN